MKRMAALSGVLFILFPAILLAAEPASEARNTEIAFAKAFADRDADAFFAFVADDAHFLSARRDLSGKAEIRQVWSEYLKKQTPPFSWEPERVVTNAAGDLALSTGPIHDPEGKLLGYYSSIWQKQADGTWKIIFDGPGACP
ncbi:MAG: nuclear transport factor 2 family protein [Thermoanaerobaculia bacterium]